MILKVERKEVFFLDFINDKNENNDASTNSSNQHIII